MRRFLLLQEIYVEAFKDWTYKILRRYFKAFSAFCLLMLVVVIYAFIYRVSTGFYF
jgi:hypothetical protein